MKGYEFFLRLLNIAVVPITLAALS